MVASEDGVDLGRIKHDEPGAAPHREALQGPSGAGLRELAGEQGQIGSCTAARSRSRDGGLEALEAHRLDEVVQGRELEGAQGVPFVRRDEDDGRARLWQCLRDAEPVELGHVDVEEQNVGARRRDLLQRLQAVARLAHDRYALQARQEASQALAGGGFVIGDETAQHGTLRWGMGY
jgi:hypothetical protein